MLEVLSALKKGGFRLPTHWLQNPESKCLYLMLFRKYSVADWNASRLLKLCPRSGSEIYNHPDGQVRFIASKTNDKADFVADRAGHGHWIIIPERVKHELERAGLIGLKFDEAIPCRWDWGRGGAVTPLKKAPERLGRWWRLLSDVTMPPLSQSCDVRVNEFPQTTRDGTPMPYALGPGDPPYVYWREGLFVCPEPHYRAADLEAMAPFDIALAREKSGSPRVGPSYGLIVSNRFYKVCRALEYRVSWIPVRLD